MCEADIISKKETMDRSSSFTGSWSLRLIIINVVIYFLEILLFQGEGQRYLTYYFGLIPLLVLKNGFIWQIFTYMFIHGSWMHIFFNMYALLLFGAPIEEVWGSKKFLIYYLFTGVGAGITIFALNIIIGGEASMIPTIGASGAVFGILLAFGILFPDTQILLFFFIPIKAKFLVILYGGIELYSMITTMGSSNISHIGHLGGLLFGIIYFLVLKRKSIKFRMKVTKNKNRFFREVGQGTAEAKPEPGNNKAFLMNLLHKVKAQGPQSLTDDEFQTLRYLMIMNEGDKSCVEDDFNKDDDYCYKCDTYEACILRELKKYL